MIQSRDLVLARWVLQFRKVPKIAVAQALRSTQLKRDQGVQTSLAKILVEHGWLSITDLREIVARASQEAYVCGGCGRRFALPSNETGIQPPCPQCGGQLAPDQDPTASPLQPAAEPSPEPPAAWGSARRRPRFQWDESDERPPSSGSAPAQPAVDDASQPAWEPPVQDHASSTSSSTVAPPPPAYPAEPTPSARPISDEASPPSHDEPLLEEEPLLAEEEELPETSDDYAEETEEEGLPLEISEDYADETEEEEELPESFEDDDEDDPTEDLSLLVASQPQQPESPTATEPSPKKGFARQRQRGLDTSDPDLEQHALVKTDERVVRLDALLRSSETGERPAAVFPETLSDPLGGDLATESVSGRMMLELTSWNNVNEFLGVDVPAMDLSSSAASLPVLDPDTLETGPELGDEDGAAAAQVQTVEVAVPVSRRQGWKQKLSQPAVLGAGAGIVLVLLLGTTRIMSSRRIRTLEQEIAQIRKRGDRPRAAAMLDELCELTSQRPEAVLQRGQLALEMQKSRQALVDADAVLRDQPRNEEAHGLKARALASRGQLNESLKSFQSAWDLSGGTLANERQVQLAEEVAWTALAVGSLGRARKWAAQVLEQDPTRPAAATIQGWTRLASGDAGAAAAVLSKVTEGSTPLLWLLRARSRLLQEDAEGALRDLLSLEATVLDSNLTALAARLRAQARIRLGHAPARRTGELSASPTAPAEQTALLEQALSDLDQTLGRAKPAIGTLVDLAAPAFLRGRTREATAEEASLLLSGSDTSSSNSERLLRGLALEGLGRTNEALEAAGAACESDVDDPNALALHTRLTLTREGLHPSTSGTLRVRRDPVTVTEQERQALKQAEARYTDCLNQRRRAKLWDEARIRRERGDVHLLLSQTSQATEDARIARDTGAKNLDLLLFAADAWLALGTRSKVEDAVRDIPEIQPEQPAVSLRRIRLRILNVSSSLDPNRELRLAGQELTMLLSRCEGQRPVLQALQGRVLLQRGERQRAISLLEEATREDATQARAWLDLAEAQQKEGRIAQSLDALHQATRAAPRWLRPFTERARLLESEDKLEEAAAAYDTALIIAPGNDEIHLRRLLLADEIDPPRIVLRQVRRAAESAGSAEVLKLIRLRALARVGRLAEATREAEALDEIDSSGRLRALGDAMVQAWQYDLLKDVPPGYWISIRSWLKGVDEAIADIPNHRGGREIRAMYLDLLARTLEAAGDVELSRTTQDEARRLRQAGHREGVQ